MPSISVAGLMLWAICPRTSTWQKRIEMTALSVNELAVIVNDANGTYWYLGKDNAVTASNGTGQTGTARTDGNMYTIELSDESATYPYEVDATIVAGLVA